jgi:hypothetical protein
MKALNVKFNRNELSGAFGDIGTSLPLIIGIIAVSGIDVAAALIMFGAMQVFTGIKYGIPISVQPLKAFAAVIIAQKLTGDVIFAGGLIVGIIMLILTFTGLVDWISRVLPICVVRGIQFGLGLQLSMLAVKNYINTGDFNGYIIAGFAFVIALVFIGNRKYPPALFLLLLGLVYILLFKHFQFSIGAVIPSFHFVHINTNFNTSNIVAGFLLLALPQIPLSLGNSIFATSQTSRDYFPERAVSVNKISLTYSIMNLVNPFFGGIPVCHGSGGMAGHYMFGARSGGSVVIYGTLFILSGLFFASGFTTFISLFPMAILGVILLFESLSLMLLMRDVVMDKKQLFITLITGILAINLPYGYAIGMITGIAVYYLPTLTRIKLPIFNK